MASAPARRCATPVTRNRAAPTRRAALLCLFVTIALGLLSRRWPLPGWFAEHTGDALYATAAFWVLAVVWPRLPVVTRALAAFSISATIECSQLLHTPWLDDLRHTRPGALILGQGFQWDDVIAYAFGALIGWCWAMVMRRR